MNIVNICIKGEQMTKRKRSDGESNQCSNQRPKLPTRDESSSANAVSLFKGRPKQPEPKLSSKSEQKYALFEEFNSSYKDPISRTYCIAPVVVETQHAYDFLSLLLLYKHTHQFLTLGQQILLCPKTRKNFNFNPDQTPYNTQTVNLFDVLRKQFSADRINEIGFMQLPLDNENSDVIEKLFERLPDSILKKYIIAASPEVNELEAMCLGNKKQYESFKSRTLLHWAIYHNKIDIVNKVIDLHPRCLIIDDVNNMDIINDVTVISSEDNAHNHALLYACRMNKPDSAMAIIEKLKNWGPFEIKEKLGNDFCIQKYLSNRDYYDGFYYKYLSPFHWACYYGQETLVKLILEVYPDICETEDPGSDNALTIACQQGELEVVKVIVENV